MTEREIIKAISVDHISAVPKYLQLADAIVSNVKSGKFGKGMLMPSINILSDELDISRPTTQKAYKHLQQSKVMDSVPGKCYFITGNISKSPLRIALFFNKLSAHKKIIYDAFIQTTGADVDVDLFIYNNDFFTFKNLLEPRLRDYSHYVIIPHFLDNSEGAARIINRIPKHKLVLLDKHVEGVTGEFGSVYEHFENDIYSALAGAGKLVEKYNTIKIVFPESSYFPVEILKGFNLFCKEKKLSRLVINDLEEDKTKKGDLYITLIETDLVLLVERMVNMNFVLGKDAGIISYNETPIKKIIREGITTISTDFQKMGEEAAKLILNNSTAKVRVPFSMIRRASL
ncbi:MAG: GntR family transcriptional regulator [Flavitalea sp.]